MKRLPSLRLLALAGALGMALGAYAVDAYSNLGSAPPRYRNGVDEAYLVSPAQVPFLGFQFTSGTTGALEGFQLAINDIGNARPFSLKLYADSGTDTLGGLLGTFGGTSSGQIYFGTDSAIVSVAAKGPTLAAGKKYWLAASTDSYNDQVAWNFSTGTTGLTNRNGAYRTESQGGFSVQVSPVPEPTTIAVLALGAASVVRRRRRAQ